MGPSRTCPENFPVTRTLVVASCNARRPDHLLWAIKPLKTQKTRRGHAPFVPCDFVLSISEGSSPNNGWNLSLTWHCFVGQKCQLEWRWGVLKMAESTLIWAKNVCRGVCWQFGENSENKIIKKRPRNAQVTAHELGQQWYANGSLH